MVSALFEVAAASSQNTPTIPHDNVEMSKRVFGGHSVGVLCEVAIASSQNTPTIQH